jgi:hypothetical protein
MANTSGLSEGSHDAEDFTAGTADAPAMPGVTGCGVLAPGATGADGSVADELLAPGAVARTAGRDVATAVPPVAADPGADRVPSTCAVT